MLEKHMTSYIPTVVKRGKNHQAPTGVENLNDYITYSMFTSHDIANIRCYLPLNARFSQRLLINFPCCQTIQHRSVSELYGTLGAFNLQNQVPVE